MYLDDDLLAEAERLLGTRGPSATVRAALEEVVRTRRLESLAAWDIGDLTPERLEELRSLRTLPAAKP